MAAFQSFQEIEAWQNGRELAREIYKISNQGSFSKDFGLRDQIRRASVSVMSNIAEGFERSGTAEFVQFLGIAKGSAGEVVSCMYVAVDQGFVAKEDFDRLYRLATTTGRKIGALMSYLRKSGIKGSKFRRS